MLRFHLERGAGATLAVIEVPSEEAQPLRRAAGRTSTTASPASSRSRSTCRRASRCSPRWASTSSTWTSWCRRSRRTRGSPTRRTISARTSFPALISQGAGLRLPLLRREQEGGEVLARHRHARRLLRSEHGPVPRQPGVQPLRSGVAAAHLPAAGAAGEVRVRRRRPPLRPGARLDHLGRLHHLGQPDRRQRALPERARAQLLRRSTRAS